MFNISRLFNIIYISPLSRIRWMMFLLPVCMLILWGMVCVCTRLTGGTRIVRIWFVLCLLAAVGIAVVIFYMTVLRRGISERAVILIPFYSFYEARRQPEIYRQMLMNVFLFEPLGLTLPFGLRWLKIQLQKQDGIRLGDMRSSVVDDDPAIQRISRISVARISFLLCLAFSILIEICQGLFSRGKTEVDDVIMNLLGASIGILCYKICEFIKS